MHDIQSISGQWNNSVCFTMKYTYHKIFVQRHLLYETTAIFLMKSCSLSYKPSRPVCHTMQQMHFCGGRYS